MPKRRVPKTVNVPIKPTQIGSQPKDKVVNVPVSNCSVTTSQAETNVLDTDTGLAQQFEVELCWCIQQLQTALLTRKTQMNPKQSNNVLRSLNVLKNNNAPLIKKRQVMRSTFGDYRQKMAEEEKKYKRDKPIIKFDVSSPSKKSRFLKHSTFSSIVLKCKKIEQSDNSFRFNFNNSLGDADDNATSENRNIVNVEAPKADKKVSVVVENTCPVDTQSSFKYHSSDNSFRFNFDVPVHETVKE